MSDPYDVLNLTRDADAAEIRRRYLELVREFPPDRAPERFAVIRKAYDEVRDPLKQLRSQLFETATTDSIDAILTELRARLRETRVPIATLLKLAETT